MSSSNLTKHMLKLVCVTIHSSKLSGERQRQTDREEITKYFAVKRKELEILILVTADMSIVMPVKSHLSR